MLHDGLYEQIINKALDTELSATDKLNQTAPIDTAEASKVLAKYVAEVVERGLDNLRDNGGDLNAQVALELKPKIDDMLDSIIDNKLDGIVIDYKLSSQKVISYSGVLLANRLGERLYSFPIFVLTTYQDDLFDHELFTSAGTCTAGRSARCKSSPRRSRTSCVSFSEAIHSFARLRTTSPRSAAKRWTVRIWS